MKSEDIFKAVGQVDDKFIDDAKPKNKKKRSRKSSFIAATAAVLAIVIIGGIWFYPSSKEKFPLLSAYAVAEPEYPVMAPYPDERDYILNSVFDNAGFDTAYDAWHKDKRKQLDQYKGYTEGLDHFFAETVKTILTEGSGKNRVYSPLSLYLALGMLCELTDGNTREQILDLLGYQTIDELRRQANAVWNSNYCNDGAVISTLASSLWLNEDVAFKQETINILKSTYFASTYKGEMGSEEFNKALQEWINSETGGLLSDYSSGLEMSTDTILALITTIYFRAKWSDEFYTNNAEQGIFYAKSGNIQCDFMNESTRSNYYWGEKFSAVSKSLQESGGMWFILPDENITADELLQNEEVLNFIASNGDTENRKYAKINMTIPKFDISSNLNLTESIKKLGITDVFDSEKADFTPTAEKSDDFYTDKIEQCARVAINEEGCTAVSYTAMMTLGASAPDDEVDFVVNRPFIFVITGSSGLPLFVGVVEQPE